QIRHDSECALPRTFAPAARRAQPARIEPDFCDSRALGQCGLEAYPCGVSAFPQPTSRYEQLSEQTRRSRRFLQDPEWPRIGQLPPQTFQFFGALCVYEILHAEGLPDPWFSDKALWRGQVSIS